MTAERVRPPEVEPHATGPRAAKAAQAHRAAAFHHESAAHHHRKAAERYAENDLEEARWHAEMAREHGRAALEHEDEALNGVTRDAPADPERQHRIAREAVRPEPSEDSGLKRP